MPFYIHLQGDELQIVLGFRHCMCTQTFLNVCFCIYLPFYPATVPIYFSAVTHNTLLPLNT